MNSAPVCGVGGVMLKDGHILLVQRGRPPSEGLWAIPGGKIRFGETMSEAVEREVFEETGLQTRPGKVIWAGDSIGPGDPPAWHFCLVDFLCEVEGGELMAGDDAAATAWVPLAEATSFPLTPTMFELVVLLVRGVY